MRVLHLIDGFRLGGAEALLANLGPGTATGSLESRALALSPPSSDRSALEPVLTAAGLAPDYLGFRRTLDAAALARLVRTIRADEADVVHAHLEMASTAGVLAAKLAGRPVVSTFHHVVRPLPARATARERAALEVATRLGDAVLFCSQASLDSFQDRYRAHRPVPANWQVVHNGIDVARFPATPAGTPLPADLAGRGPVLTVLAALRDFKGIDTAVRALPAVLEEFPSARLLLVGSGSEETTLRRLTRDLGLEGSVEFVGTRHDVAEVLAGSDLVLLPSTHGENLPTTLMEAGSCARAVVASSIAGIPDIVEHGRTGLLVPPGDVPAFAAAVIGLLADEPWRTHLGRAARERIEERFSIPVWTRELQRVYQGVLSSRAGNPRTRKNSTVAAGGDPARSATTPDGAPEDGRPVVVVVAEAFPMRGGIATFAENLVNDPRLAERFDVRLLNTSRTADREGNRLVLGNVLGALDAARRTFLASRNSDVVHLQLVADPGLSMVRTAATCLAARCGGAVVLAHSHSAIGNAARPDVKTYGRLDRLLLRTLTGAAEVLTVSRAGADLLRPLLRGTPVTAVDNAVDVPSFTPDGPRDHDEVPEVLFVGVVCRRKGVDDLARAVAALTARGRRLRLVVVGGQGPTPEQEYREIVEEFSGLGLTDSLVGSEDADQVRKRLGSCDVFALPSYLEGQPMAILEAMAAGVPVVGSSIGAVPETVRDGIDGFVVEPGDLVGLTGALDALVSDASLRRRLGENAGRRARETYDLPRLSERVGAAYDRVLAARRRSIPAPVDGGVHA